MKKVNLLLKGFKLVLRVPNYLLQRITLLYLSPLIFHRKQRGLLIYLQTQKQNKNIKESALLSFPDA